MASAAREIPGYLKYWSRIRVHTPLICSRQGGGVELG